MNGHRKVILLILSLLSPLLYAEQTLIVGDIHSEQTGLAIADASIYYQGTSIGTASDSTGAFVLEADLNRKRTLVVSAIGYRSEYIPVEPGVTAGIEVALREKTILLDEVLATIGENEAIPLLEQVRAHREQNEPRLAHTPDAVTSLYISDIRKSHLQRRLWQSMRSGLIAQTDSTYLLPLYRSDQGAIIMSETDYRVLLTDEGNISFYEPRVFLMGRAFLSPLARNGLSYYHYYLVDSIASDEGKNYVVDFKTRNPYFETFNGTLLIDSATYAIRSVEAEVPRQTAVNYLSGATIRQHFATDRSLAYEQVTMLLDFAVKTDNSHIFPTVLITHERGQKDADIPTTTPMETPSAPTSEDYTVAMDSLRDLPIVRVATWLATIINTGYIPTGTCVDIGSVREILEVNRHETVHVGIPLRTNERLFPHVSLEACLAYGFGDHKFKGSGAVEIRIPSLREHRLRLAYREGYTWLEDNDLLRESLYERRGALRFMDFAGYFAEAMPYYRAIPSTAVYHRQGQITAFNPWTDYLTTNTYLQVGQYPSFTYQTLGSLIHLRFAGHPWPHLDLQLEGGSYQNTTTATGLYRMYARLGLNLQQTIDLGIGGRITYALSGATLLGHNLPRELRYTLAGGRGYGYDPYRFSQMGIGQYLANRYVALYLDWNGRGVLFNRIPGIRNLRLRELLEAKLVYADSTPMPYAELGVGIGNILRVADLWAVFRLTNSGSEEIPFWGIRCRMNIDF